MMKGPIIWAFLLALCLTSCGTSRQVAGTSSSDSTTVRIIEHKEYVPVQVLIPLPLIKETVTTRDTSSHLENQYAQSDARINSDGSLYHTLETKPQTIEAETQVKIEYKDSIVFRDRFIENTVEVEVEKELTWWQSFKMKVGGYALGIILLALIYLIVRLVLKIK